MTILYKEKKEDLVSHVERFMKYERVLLIVYPKPGYFEIQEEIMVNKIYDEMEIIKVESDFFKFTNKQYIAQRVNYLE